jgi:hypothetical protein
VKPARVLPPGTVLPPLVTGDAGKGASKRRPGGKGGKPHARRSRRRAGRFHVLNGFVDGVMGTLPRAAVCVWLALYRDTKPNGLARAGVADLAKRAECDRSTVIRAVRLLVEGGSLDVVRRGGIGRGPSVYRVK